MTTTTAVWPDTAEITSPDAIAVLTNLRSLRYLRPFMVAPQTLSSAAAELNKPVSTVAYWIPRFRRVGLVEHLGDTTRTGMAMPTYRATARRLTVPFDKLPFDSRVELLDSGRMRVLRRFLDGLDEALEAEEAFSLAFFAEGEGQFAIDMVESDASRDQRGFTDGWRTFRLSTDEAREFARELEALIEKYGHDTGPRRYVAHMGLAPEPRHRWRSANDFGPP